MYQIYFIFKERERRYEIIPEKSAVDVSSVGIDQTTREMLRLNGLTNVLSHTFVK